MRRIDHIGQSDGLLSTNQIADQQTREVAQVTGHRVERQICGYSVPSDPVFSLPQKTHVTSNGLGGRIAIFLGRGRMF